ncbi:MAG TPA: segregation/condensation protein A [Polyangia bacterium]|jgi:segregation and condensation protein A|nr:segregation/condensation protein A [Polyangia bacterium]
MNDAERPPSSAPAPSPTPPDDEHEPIAVGDDAVLIQLPEFEGPLDLLLHLIHKEELEIINIPISLITERYLSYLKLMQSLNIDIAGEYLLMAATLAYLKSRELVPQAPEQVDEVAEEEDGIDARQKLIQRLLEYQKYKEAAAHLGGRPVMGRNVWGRGTSPELVSGIPPHSGEQLEEIPVFRLIEALEQVLGRARIKLTHDVVIERISITDKINEIVDRLGREANFTFSSCFAFVETPMPLEELRHQVVITFLALLEMTRLRMIRLHQTADRSEIYVSFTMTAVPAPPVSVEGTAQEPLDPENATTVAPSSDDENA